MPRKKDQDHEKLVEEYEDFAEEYGEEELEELLEILDEFPELGDYLDIDLMGLDDEDFYEGGV